MNALLVAGCSLVLSGRLVGAVSWKPCDNAPLCLCSGGGLVVRCSVLDRLSLKHNGTTAHDNSEYVFVCVWFGCLVQPKKMVKMTK